VLLIETIGMATAKIQSGMAHCIIAGGAESMSFVLMEVTSLLRIMLLPKQETKITTGNGFNSRSSNSLRFLEKIKMNLLITLMKALKAQAEGI
jgi:acetyl-CoA acetyltransferase